MTQLTDITASTTNFLLNVGNADLVGSDNFTLQVNGLSVNGTPITIPDLNSSFGLYIEGTTTVHGSPSVYGPGSVALILDPTNNDGTPSATWDPLVQSGSVGFSNLVGTADDIVLATGSIINGTFGTQSNGQPGLNLVETFQLHPAVFGPFLSHLSSSFNLEETLFNTATSRQAGSTDAGGSWVTVNDGYGIANLIPASGSDGTDGSGAATNPFSQPWVAQAIAKELMSALGIASSATSGGHQWGEADRSWRGGWASNTDNAGQAVGWVGEPQSQVT